MRKGVLVLALALGVAGPAGADSVELPEAVQAHVGEIYARNPELRDHAFSKMGGSSVASKAFLHCFSTPYVDLGEHPELAGTIEYFNATTPNPFSRESEATGVNWNLRYVLGGRPANYRKELAATRARWALVLFGSNDAQNQNERVYLARLVYLVEQLEEAGVVPVLGSALPRRSGYRDRWISRFNDITEAVAEHWSLPYIDYHAAMSSLPRKGLARDGVHPNVFGQGGLRTACQLTEKALRYGNNVRNLLTVEMLDALRKTVAGADVQADAGAGTDAGTGTGAGAGTDAGTGTDPFPISALISKPDLPLAGVLPRNCGSAKPNSRLYRTRIDITARTRVRASGLDLDGYTPRVFWVRVDENTERCVRRRNQTLEVDVQPGMWDLIVEVPERAAQEGQMLILVTRDPR
jgi:hypothetical protein